ncbi:MAG: CHASE2 domain-containing protein [Alphaproteobacteria bacterium]
MKHSQPAKRRLWTSLSVCLSLTLAFWVGIVGAGNRMLEDWRFKAAPFEASGEVVIAAIDAKSLNDVGVWPWSRDIHARILERLHEAGVVEVAFDVDFSQASTVAGDDMFAAALQETGGLAILPAFLQPEATGVSNSEIILTKPIAKFADAAWLGLINVFTDRAGMVRSVHRSIEVAGEYYPAMAELLAGAPFPQNRDLRINFGIRPDRIPHISVSDLLNGTINPAMLAGKKVIVGATAIELGDKFSVPVYGVLSGPVIQALAVESLVQGRALAPVPPIGWIIAGIGLILFLVLFLPDLRFVRELFLLSALVACTELMALLVHVHTSVELPTFAIHLTVFVCFVIAVVRELQQRKVVGTLALLRSADNERLLERILQDSFDGIIIAEETGRILRVNSTGRRILFGNTQPALGGRRLGEVLPSHVANDVMNAVNEIVNDPRRQPIVNEICIGPGNAITCYLELIVTSSAMDGSRNVLALTFRDVTARRQAEIQAETLAEEAMRASRAKSNFLAAVSHELRTPLNAIIGFSDMMRSDTGLKIPVRDYSRYAEDIHKSGSHLLSIVNDILDITRIEKGEFDVRQELVDLGELFGELKMMFSGWPVAADRRIRFDADTPSTIAHCDPRVIRQILVNLVTNAIKFTGDGGHVDVTVRRMASGDLVMQVADDGMGISAEELENITKPFYRADAHLARNGEGAGLGLAIVKGLAQSHGGRLDIESQPGAGTIMRITIPAQASEMPEYQAA